MARDFTKSNTVSMNFPAGTLGTLLNGASAISQAAWINIDSTETAVRNNRILSALIATGSNGFSMSVDNTGPTRILDVYGRSVTGETLERKQSTTDMTLTTWHHVGGVNDIGGDTITPYVNGVAEGGGAVTFDNTTYTQGATPTTGDGIGCFDSDETATVTDFDGRIAELAIWSVDIGAAGFASLSDGFSPLFIRPDSLVFYIPLWGNNSPERDIVSGNTATIEGTIAKADHPRIIYPVSPQNRRFRRGIANPRRRMMTGVGI